MNTTDHPSVPPPQPEPEHKLEPQGTPTRSFGRLLVTGIGVALVIAVMWIVIALLNPTITYHLSPLLFAAAPSVVARLQAERTLPWWQALITAATGAILAGITTTILALADAFRGPVIATELTGFLGGALGETVVVLLIGSALGGVFAALRPRARY